MEVMINFLVVGYTLLVLLIVERFLFKGVISTYKVERYAQKKNLDLLDDNPRLKMMNRRGVIKYTLIIFSGLLLFIVLIAIPSTKLPFSTINFIFFFVSAIELIVYGAVKALSVEGTFDLVLSIFVFIVLFLFILDVDKSDGRSFFQVYFYYIVLTFIFVKQYFAKTKNYV